MKTEVNNYRVISLLKNVSKIFEKCIYGYIFPIVRNLIIESQHGFLNKRSTSTNLVEFYNDISIELDRGA